MGRYARLLGAALALGVGGCDLVAPGFVAQPSRLVCHGDFAQFANGFMVSRPMELDFAVYWTPPAIYPLNGGGPARIITQNSLELAFEVQYEGYRAAYHLSRVDGTFTQRPNLGGVFFGKCHLEPLATKI